MFRKWKLKSGIRKAKKRIRALEARRARSQAALVEAIVAQRHPEDSDVEYFNRFTERIEAQRRRLRALTDELEDRKPTE